MKFRTRLFLTSVTVAAATLLVVALAHGVVLAVLVSSFGAVSGGHFNPAVTLGLWIAGQIDAVKGLAYVVAQLLGGAAAGFALAAHWSTLLVVIAFFALIYAPTMERERANISGRFPEAYAAYEQNVPAFFPRPLPWRGGSGADSTPFSLALYMSHGEWKAALGFVLAVGWLVFRMER